MLDPADQPPRDPFNPTSPLSPPPRAFTQGVGTVFQIAGVTLFVLSMSICCLSSLWGKAAIGQASLRAGWAMRGDPPGEPTYSIPRATTLCLAEAVFAGLAMAGLGLGMQAQRRASPWGASMVTLFSAVFWAIHVAFAISAMHSVWFALLSAALAVGFALLFVLAALALLEMRRDPPPRGHELLPAGYKIPYSHLHAESPEARWAQELEQRRQRLAVQQKELESLEIKLRRKLDAKADADAKARIDNSVDGTDRTDPASSSEDGP